MAYCTELTLRLVCAADYRSEARYATWVALQALQGKIALALRLRHKPFSALLYIVEYLHPIAAIDGNGFHKFMFVQISGIN